METRGDSNPGLVRSRHNPTAVAARYAVLACVACLPLALLTFVPAAGAASGGLAWQRVYNGTSNGVDAFLAAAPAPNGGVYVAGRTLTADDDLLVARYDGAGRRRWLRTYNSPVNGPDIVSSAAADIAGNLVVVGTANDDDMEVVKYAPGGQRRWARTYDPASPMEGARDVTIDGAGSIYVLGSRYSAAAGYDIAVLKYSPAGVRRWVRSYAGPAGDDVPWAIATDSGGNVYVAGYSPGVGTSLDIVTIKYDPAGRRRWVRRWDGPAGGADQGYAIAVSGAGTVYVAGRAAAISSGTDAVVLKYASNGALRWSRLRSSPGAFGDTYRDVALLGNGDVLATGNVYGGPLADNDVLLVRLSPAGKTRWARVYNGPDGLSDVGDHVAQSATGAIYVTGTSFGATTNSDILTLKYNPAGVLRWAERYTSAGAGSDGDTALVARDQGVYVAGYQESATVSDATLLKYMP